MAELVVALDFDSPDTAMDMAGRLQSRISWVKVGLELFTAAGPGVVAGLKALGFKVFVDLKFMDIPNTVRGAVRSVTGAGADMVNIHVLGGRAMAEAALEGLPGHGGAGPSPLLLGVTLLTSLESGDLPWDVSGISSGEMVLSLAAKARLWGLDGVVCSGREAASVKSACGRGFLCVTPGIRTGPAGDDQQRTVTPEQAVAWGSDFLVVGRPITRAADPSAALSTILERMRRA
ncbi:MAG: orotidine-5'-phosphate decarboxylase [Desulfohalobiaceae bacterium]